MDATLCALEVFVYGLEGSVGEIDTCESSESSLEVMIVVLLTENVLNICSRKCGQQSLSPIRLGILTLFKLSFQSHFI